MQTLVTPVTKDGPSHITRTCVDDTETLSFCQNETLLEKQNYEIDCCNGSLCNAGREPPRQIECWTCEADLTKDGYPKDNSSCSRDDFNGTGATLMRCDSDRELAGYCTVCIKYYNRVVKVPCYIPSATSRGQKKK